MLLEHVVQIVTSLFEVIDIALVEIQLRRIEAPEKRLQHAPGDIIVQRAPRQVFASHQSLNDIGNVAILWPGLGQALGHRCLRTSEGSDANGHSRPFHIATQVVTE